MLYRAPSLFPWLSAISLRTRSRIRHRDRSNYRGRPAGGDHGSASDNVVSKRPCADESRLQQNERLCVSRSTSALPDLPVRAARRVIKVTGAHRRIKTVPRMTKPGPAPQWSAMAPTAGGIAIAASRFMVWRSPTTEAPGPLPSRQRTSSPGGCRTGPSARRHGSTETPTAMSGRRPAPPQTKNGAVDRGNLEAGSPPVFDDREGYDDPPFRQMRRPYARGRGLILSPPACSELVARRRCSHYERVEGEKICRRQQKRRSSGGRRSPM
jgi:hypothetical protein